MLNIVLIGSFVFYLVIGFVAAVRLTHVLDVFEKQLEREEEREVQQTGCLHKWRRKYIDVAGKMRYIKRGRRVFQWGMNIRR